MVSTRSKRNRKVKKTSKVHKLKRIHLSLTNYPRRYRLLKGRRPYLTVVCSNRKFDVLMFNDVQLPGTISESMCSKSLQKLGYEGSLISRKAAYLFGYLFGRTMKNKNIQDRFLINFGIKSPTRHGRFYSLLRGIHESEFEIDCSEKNFPSDELLSRNDSKEMEKIMKFKEKIRNETK